MIEQVRDLGLIVHTWTFRNDASGYGFADPQTEMTYYYDLGVDGLFTDFPDTAWMNPMLSMVVKNHQCGRGHGKHGNH